MVNKKVTTLFIVFSVIAIVFLSIVNNKETNNNTESKKITLDELVQSEIDYYTRINNNNYSKFEYKINDLIVKYVVAIETYTPDGRNFHGAKFLTYERNNINEEFTLSRTGGLTTRKPYQELLDFVKNNNVFDYTDKQLSDMFGSASLESGYYLGQFLSDTNKGLPATIYRSFSPNYKNLVYVYKNAQDDTKHDWNTRVFIENGDNDIWISEVVPFSFYPLFHNDYERYKPIVFINDQEFYFISQPNWGAEGRENQASNKLKSLENINDGVYVFNIETLEWRLIDELPQTTRKYKYITFQENLYVYGGNLEGVRQYNSKGEFVKEIEYRSKDRDLAVINFTGWGTNDLIDEQTGKEYKIANFENNDVRNYVDGMTAVIDLE